MGQASKYLIRSKLIKTESFHTENSSFHNPFVVGINPHFYVPIT